MQSINKIAVIGDGGWGTTLAILLSRKGCEVTIWGAFPDYIEILRNNRENIKYLPGVKIPETIKITSDMDEAVAGKDIVILAIPSQFMRDTITRLKMSALSNRIFVSVAKGIENKTLKRMSEVIKEV